MDRKTRLSFVESYCEDAVRAQQSVLSLKDSIIDCVDLLYASAQSGGTIFTCGNGGSACDAMHLAEELVARYLRERPGIRAQHLIDSGTMTCWANDYDFHSVFRRQVETLVEPRDVVIGFSTSGNSPNVLQAIEAANRLGANTVALTGRDGGKLASLAKLSLIVDSKLTSHIQEAHVSIVHILCDLLEQQLFPECVSLKKQNT